MGAFAVSLWDRSNSAFDLPPDLVLTPTRWGAVAQGGYDSAEIDVTGPGMQLRDVRKWLRYRVQILGVGGLVWDGFINEISLNIGGATVTVTTERMFNAVKVLYSYTGDDGGGESAETDWLTDTASINEYGRKEVLHSAGGEITKDAANTMRLTVLNAHAKANAPSVSVSPQQGVRVDSATLYCTGRFHDYEWRYYLDATGYEAHEDVGGQRALLGWKLTAATIGFVGAPLNRILDFGGKLAGLKENDQLLVSGSGSNNGVKVVKTGTDGDIKNYTSTGISFDPLDDIRDSNQGLSFIRAREGLKVTGSPNNDGYYFIGDTVGAAAIETTSTFGAVPIQSDSAGPSVRLDMSHNVECSTALANEIPGSTVTLTAYGQKVAQRFQLTSGPWDAGELAVHIKTVGTPSDDVTLQLYSDNAAAPNTLLGTATIANADITKTAAWHTAKLATPVSLLNATYYQFVVARTGTADATNYFEVSLDDEGTYPRGGLRLYDGTAWQVPAMSADMPFKVHGVVTTTQKIVDITNAVGNQGVLRASIIAPTTVYTRRKRDGRSTAWEEIRTLLNIGNAAGQRLIGAVSDEGVFVVDAEPAQDPLDLIWRDDGRLLYADGREVTPGYLPAGRWVRIDSLVGDSWQSDISKMFCERAEYDTANNTWTLTPKEAPDPYSIGSEQG